jgi:hypothetical protein
MTPARLSLVRLEGLTRQLASTVSLAGFQTTPNNKPFAPSFAGSAPAATSSTSTIAAKTDVRMRARGRALQELLDRRDEERAEEEDAIPAGRYQNRTNKSVKTKASVGCVCVSACPRMSSKSVASAAG